MRYVEKNGLWVPEYTTGGGLGDLIARGLHKLGIKQKPGCGCPKRQRQLNRLIPYGAGSRWAGYVPAMMGSMAAPDGQEDICNRADVFYCENFEVGRTDACFAGSGGVGNCPDKFKSPFTHDVAYQGSWGPGGRAQITNTAQDGTKALQENFPACPPDVSSCGIGWWFPLNNAGAFYPEIYIREYLRYSPGWVFQSRLKHYEFINTTDTAFASVHLMWHDDQFTGGELGAEAQGVAAQHYQENQGNNITLVGGPWYCVEFHIVMNSGAATNDGLIEWWIDDGAGGTPVLRGRWPGITIRAEGAYNGTNQFRLTGSGMGNLNGKNTAAQSRFHDRIVMATQRIGCTGSFVPPPPPANPIVATGGGFGFTGQTISGGR